MIQITYSVLENQPWLVVNNQTLFWPISQRVEMTDGYVPEIEVKYGNVPGYGGPGYDWSRVVSKNRVLFV